MTTLLVGPQHVPAPDGNLNTYNAVDLEHLLQATLRVFLNDPDSETWATFPFCTFLTFVAHNEGITEMMRVTANKTPRKHYEFVTGMKIEVADDGRPDFNISTADGIFTLLAEMKPPKAHVFAARSNQHTKAGDLLASYQKGIQQLDSRMATAVKINNEAKKGWGKFIAGLVTDGFRYRCRLYDHDGSLVYDDGTFLEVLSGAGQRNPSLQVNAANLAHVTLFLKRAVLGYFRNMSMDGVLIPATPVRPPQGRMAPSTPSTSRAGAASSSTAFDSRLAAVADTAESVRVQKQEDALKDAAKAAWTQLVNQDRLRMSDIQRFLQVHTVVPITAGKKALNELGQAISKYFNVRWVMIKRNGVKQHTNSDDAETSG